MIPELKKTTEHKMHRSIDALKADLAKVRTGRAHTGILDHVTVEYYGSPVPIAQVANITLIDARTLGVQVWEKTMAGKVERAIREILDATLSTTQLVNDITRTIGEQSQASNEIAHQLETIAQMTESNNAEAQNTASASEELQALARDLHTNVACFQV